MARLVSQVQDVARDVVLGGEVRHDPGLVGRRHLQPTDGAVAALAAPEQTDTDQTGVTSAGVWPLTG